MIAILLIALALAPAPARVQVTASEYEYALSRQKVKQGKAIIQLVNLGEDPHDLAIRRNATGAKTYRIRDVRPGGVANLSLRLYPGRYRIWCTVGDHHTRGMHATLTVRR